MDYVRFYKKSLGIDFSGKDYDIHHLDGNHGNNNLSNLLLLPKKLHHQYHFSCPPKEVCTPDLVPQSILEPGVGFNNFLLESLEHFFTAYIECCKWADYKEYLLGNIPNIHGIEL